MKKILFLLLGLTLAGCNTQSNQELEQQTGTVSNQTGDVVVNSGDSQSGSGDVLSGNSQLSLENSVSAQNVEGGKVVEIDASNIKKQKDFGSGFWTDGQKVYHTDGDTELFEGLSPEGFRVIGGTRSFLFIANKYGVFVRGPFGRGDYANAPEYESIVGINDISSVKILYDNYEGAFLVDKNDIYSYNGKIYPLGADKKSFKIQFDKFSSGDEYMVYAYDDNNVYTLDGKLSYVDRKTLKYLGFDFFKDSKSVYQIYSDDNSVLEVSGLNIVDAKPLDFGIIKDSKVVLYQMPYQSEWKKLVGVDANSFDFVCKVLYLYKDKTNLYLNLDKINLKVDIGSFKSLNCNISGHGGYYQDKNNIYYIGRYEESLISKLNKSDYKIIEPKNLGTDATSHVIIIIKGADASTFKVLKNGNAEDKNNKRKNGIKQ